MSTLILPHLSGFDPALVRTGSVATTNDSYPDESQWFALHTCCRHEKHVAAQLQNKGIDVFLPLTSKVSRWSDRRKTIEIPLFSCYVFVCLKLASRERAVAVQVPGVLRFVGFHDGPAPIPRSEIESIQKALAVPASCFPYAFLKTGQKVRIRGGSLDGVEGILVGRQGEHRLVISIHLIQKSMAVVVEGYDVEPVG